MMKIVLIGLLLASLPAYAQKKNHSKAPEPVRLAFSKQFPGVDDARWEKEKGKYEANFRQDGKNISATYDNNGTWLETEKAISIKALPTEITIYIEKNFKGKTARSASIINLASGETNYEAHLNNTDYIFDASGKFIKSEKD